MKNGRPTPPGQFRIDFFGDEGSGAASGIRQTAPPLHTDNVAGRENQLHFLSFGSGSSGNSCYIGNSSGGIIVDVGVREDVIVSELAACGVPMSKVRGVLLTHDHADHVRYVYALLRRHKHLHLFCTNRVLNGIFQRHSLSKRLREYHIPIYKEIPFRLAEFEITAFEVPHDGSDNMGFFLQYGNHNFALATDLGEVQERARHYMSRANYLVIEANYDSDMLRLGSYPEYLKARIRTSNGHMDNEDTAAFLAEMVNPDLSHIFLCHLSHDNNTPDKAVGAVRRALEAKGLKVGTAQDTLADREADVQLMALPRYDSTRWFVFRR